VSKFLDGDACNYRLFVTETKKFYSLLSRIGTDFSLMCRLFPGRNRPELKVCFSRQKFDFISILINVEDCNLFDLAAWISFSISDKLAWL